MKMTSASYEIAKRTLKLSRTETGVQVEILTLGAVTYRTHFVAAGIVFRSVPDRQKFFNSLTDLAAHIFGVNSRTKTVACNNDAVQNLIHAIEQLA